MCKCNEKIKTKNKRLLQSFQPVIGSHIVLYQMGDPDQLIFPVDSTTWATAEEFKKRVLKECEGVKENVPLLWFILEQVLHLLAEEMKVTVSNITECFKAANQMFSMSCNAVIKYL